MVIAVTEGLGKLKLRVKGIKLEAKAQNLKYQPLRFRLQLVSEIIIWTSY